MGKLVSGILGPVSGRIGGVVGASWKGVKYLRSYVVPGASNTLAQTQQRARFAAMIIPAKYFTTRIFNPYVDKFLTRQSGFNRYVSANIPKAPLYLPVLNHSVTSGPLHPGSGLAAVYTTGTGSMAVTWTASLGIDGLATDVAIAWARHRVTGVVTFSADGERADAAATIACAAGLTATDFDVGVFFAQMNGALVSKISTNLAVTASAA